MHSCAWCRRGCATSRGATGGCPRGRLRAGYRGGSGWGCGSSRCGTWCCGGGSRSAGANLRRRWKPDRIANFNHIAVCNFVEGTELVIEIQITVNVTGDQSQGITGFHRISAAGLTGTRSGRRCCGGCGRGGRTNARRCCRRGRRCAGRRCRTGECACGANANTLAFVGLAIVIDQEAAFDAQLIAAGDRCVVINNHRVTAGAGSAETRHPFVLQPTEDPVAGGDGHITGIGAAHELFKAGLIKHPEIQAAGQFTAILWLNGQAQRNLRIAPFRFQAQEMLVILLR